MRITLATLGRRARRSVALVATCLIAVALVGTSAASAAPPAPFSNGFEADTAGWTGAARVASGTDGVTSKTGIYHAEVGTAFTNWGGYSTTFPAGGYTTSVDIYLNAVCPADDTRFDWTSAINDSTGAHRRDFVFNAGCYSGTPDHFTISASNNAGRGGAFPANPGRDPVNIETSGWYTFQHHFYNNGGTLAVDMSVLDSAGNLVKTWTLSDPGDLIGGIGGNRYGWFAANEFPFLAIDNSRLTVGPTPCTFTDSGTTRKLDADCTTDHTITVPAGYTLDGQRHTITAVDPSGDHFRGAVVTNTAGGNMTVTNLGVTASALTDACDGGADALSGILLDGGSGSITNNSVLHLNQGHSGCQEGDAIYSTARTPKTVTISGNTVSDYQKNGITTNGSVTASVTGNTITGAGPVDYIAQNGIQVAYGAVATIQGNSVSGNWYTPPGYVACGLLLYQAGGVKASNNSLFANERDQCNFGKGGGNFKPAG